MGTGYGAQGTGFTLDFCQFTVSLIFFAQYGAPVLCALYPALCNKKAGRSGCESCPTGLEGGWLRGSSHATVGRGVTDAATDVLCGGEAE